MKRRLRLTWITAFVSVWVGDLLQVSPLDAPRLPAVVMGLIAAFQLGNSLLVRGGDWKVPEAARLLRRELLYGALFGLAATIWAVSTGLPADLLGLVLTAGPVWNYNALQRQIRKRLDAAGRPRKTKLIADHRLFSDDDETLQETALYDQELPLHGLMGPLLVNEPSMLASRTRLLVSYAVGAVFMTVSAHAATIVVGANPPAPITSTVAPRGTKPSGGGSQSSRAQSGNSGGSGGGAGGPQPPAKRLQSPGCVDPGAGAPEWAYPHVHALYLNVSLAPGTTAAGCTGMAYAPAWADGHFIYGYGSLPSASPTDWLSLFVDSTEFHPALFLAPATLPVNALIQSGLVVGGSRRMTVGNGDLYLVYTPAGTYVLVRSETHKPGDPNATVGYQEIPPAAVTAWIYLMRYFGGEDWLWPHVVARSASARTITLSRLGYGSGRLAAITFDARTGVAVLHYLMHQTTFSSPATELELDELREYDAYAK